MVFAYFVGIFRLFLHEGALFSAADALRQKLL